MSDARLWVAGLVALPALVIGASALRIDIERLRRLAVVSAIAMVLAALVIALSPRCATLRSAPPRSRRFPTKKTSFESIRSRALLPFAAGLWLLTVAVTPRAALDRRGLRRTALATLLTLTSFLTESAVVLLAVVGSLRVDVPVCAGDPAHRHQRRVVAVYLGASTLLFGAGVALLVSPGVQNTRIETAAIWLIVVAALVRKGIVPFHAWVPEVFDHGRLGPAILFNAPQVGAYMTVVLIVPRASPEMLRTHRAPGACDRRIRCSPGASTAQRASGLRVPVHESVGAGDGWSRLHQRDRAGRWPAWSGCPQGWGLQDSPAVSSSSRVGVGGWT